MTAQEKWDESYKDLFQEIKNIVKASPLMDQVKVPKAMPSKASFTLCYLFEREREVVSKEEITDFIRLYWPNTSDVQQARHLGRQNGFNIQGQANGIGRGNYKLVGLDRPHPSYVKDKTVGVSAASFEELKKVYDYKCATCGNEDGKADRYNPDIIVKLEKGHMDPGKSLENNCIPQCRECNGPYKDKFVFNPQGRIIGVV
tara:strand:- start:230 stop:832 length:603 start_codon:yes stop_codon:yes gene_type:complete